LLLCDSWLKVLSEEVSLYCLVIETDDPIDEELLALERLISLKSLLSCFIAMELNKSEELALPIPLVIDL